jgi:hypothetical protein
MNAISEDLRNFDFLWSSCAFEPLGSIDHGLNYVVKAMECLRPGGVAVHTTEFNVTSNFSTIESRNLSVFRRCDFDRLERMLKPVGAKLCPINFNPGDTPLDLHYDLPPYRDVPHLKLQIDKCIVTSIGLVMRKL